jgi:hypothetical protein
MPKKPKYYFLTEDCENCHTIEHFMDMAKEQGLTTLELYEAVPDKIEGFFWCNAEGVLTENAYCGKECIDYLPRNGKSGICRHKSNLCKHGKKVVFEL